MSPPASEIQEYNSLFVGGRWIEPQSDRLIESIDPSTERVWSVAPDAAAEDVNAAVAASRAAFEGPWRSVAPTHRGDLLRRLADLVERDREKLARIESMDNGKPLRETLSEMDRAISYLTYYAGTADKLHGDQIPVNPTTLAYTRRDPVGVVAAILPWNSPLLLTTWKLGPALAAGNTIILKPSELTSASAFELARLVEEAGFPPGVVNVVSGRGAEAGAALAAHPGVDKVAFTGSHETARLIMATAAVNLKRCSFECGGKSPYLIFSDADIPKAVAGAVHSAFRSTGQSCSLTSRLFVQRAVYDDVASAIAEKAKTIKVGMPFDEATHIGPQSSAAQLQKTHGFINSALEAGFRLLAGGERPKGLDTGYFVEPTVFADVDNRSRLAQHEVFGPVLAITPFDDEGEALTMANDSSYGLVGGVWTRDIHRAHRVAHSLQVGVVAINTYRPVHWAIPYGGVKLSGLGREGGLEALEEYTETKSVVVDLSDSPARDPFA